MADVINYDMNPAQRELLYDKTRHFFNNIDAQDAMVILALITSQADVKTLIIKEITKFITSQMHLPLQQTSSCS